jgi:benzoyl-CoA reductase subunit B
MRDYFSKVLGVPTLYIESDLEDPRYFSEAQTKNRIDAFFEALEHSKATGVKSVAAMDAAANALKSLRVL